MTAEFESLVFGSVLARRYPATVGLLALLPLLLVLLLLPLLLLPLLLLIVLMAGIS